MFIRLTAADEHFIGFNGLTVTHHGRYAAALGHIESTCLRSIRWLSCPPPHLWVEGFFICLVQIACIP
jgi:hypothetical protein